MTTELYRQPSRTSQDQQLAAPSIAAAFPPNTFPFAQIMYLRDKRQFWMRVGGPVGGGAFTGVAVWEIIGGPGASLAWPKYMVNVVGQQPVTPYTNVQDAINAAVADGHNSANPTTVGVFPGTYIEDLVFAPGVVVQGLDSSVPSQVQLAGAHTIPGDVASAIYKAENVSLVGTAGNVVLTVAGTQTVSVELEDYAFFANGASAIRWTNTGASSLSLFNGTAQWTNAPVGGALVDLTVGAPCDIVAFRASFSPSATTDIAIRNLSASTLLLEDGAVSGQMICAGGILRMRRMTLLALFQPVVTASAAAVVDLEFCEVTHFTAPAAPWIVDGGGAPVTLAANALRFTDHRLIDVTIAQTTSFLHYARASSLEVGSIALFQAVDGVKIDTGGVASVVTLPPLDAVPLEHELYVKWARNAGGSVSVAPFGAEKIEDVAAAIFLAGQGATLRFEADQANGTWWVVG